MLCCLLVGTIALVQGLEEGYEITEVNGGAPNTLDGAWDTDEWEDGWIEWMDPEVSYARFGFEADTANGYAPNMFWDFSDDTDDAADLVQICIGSQVGGDAPSTSHNKIEILGHETLTVYEGDGTEWVEIDDSAVTWADSLTTTPSPMDYEHWFTEVVIDKTAIGSAAWNGPPPFDLRVAMYDASNQSWVAWPPESDPDVPESWGGILDYAASVPEVFSFGVIALLSSVAVAAVFYSKRKRPKIE
jgi:hypothetical protein